MTETQQTMTRVPIVGGPKDGATLLVYKRRLFPGYLHVFVDKMYVAEVVDEKFIFRYVPELSRSMSLDGDQESKTPSN